MQLISKYQDPQTKLLHYSRFCDNINQVFAVEADTAAVAANSRSTANFSDVEKNVLIEALKEMRFKVTANRILLKPSF